MKGVMRSPAMAAPFTRPMAAPVPISARTVAAAFHPCWIRSAPTTPVSAMVEPTDRSMPPLTMIIVMPSAPTATMTVCVKMILKLW